MTVSVPGVAVCKPKNRCRFRAREGNLFHWAKTKCCRAALPLTHALILFFFFWHRRYEDGYQYQNIFGPLVKLEADYDRQMKESQAQEGVSVRWDRALNKRFVAYFVLANISAELRIMQGDELKLSCNPTGDTHWEGRGNVLRVVDSEVRTRSLFRYHLWPP